MESETQYALPGKQLIVFDMDGVIVDVSRSYREAVRTTAVLFFQGANSWESLPDPLFSLQDLATVKQSGGLNNDWDLSCRVIELLCARVKLPETPDSADTGADGWERFRRAISRCDVGELAWFLKMQPHPLIALFKEVGKAEHPFVRGFYTADVGTGNIIKQMFQEIYLGKERFAHTYGIPPVVYSGKGLIGNETPLLDRDFIEDLATENILAIATGRPALEADDPLTRFAIKKYFRRICTHDDCVQAQEDLYRTQGTRFSFGKPHPFMLDAVAADIPDRIHRYCYVGDMPDDMIAARRSRFPYAGIGVLFTAEDRTTVRDALVRSGAHRVAEDVHELQRILKGGSDRV